MPEKEEYEKMSVFEQIKNGLEQSIAYSRGELSLRTTTLSIAPPPASARRVLALRRKLKVSQSVFAAILNVSPKLVQSWEQGAKSPQRGDLRLLQIIEKDPAIVQTLFGASRSKSRVATPKSRGAKSRAVA